MSQSKNDMMPAIALLIVLNATVLVAVAGSTWFLASKIDAAVQGRAAAAAAKPAEPEQPTEISNWRSLIRDHNATLGPEDAKIVMIEYSDFQCPFCKRHRDQTRTALMQAYGDNIRLVFKHFPLERIHPAAMIAGIAAQCARRAGKFWEMQDLLFDNQRSLSKESVIEMGTSLGLGDDFVTCVENEETRAEVQQDLDDGLQSGVRGTPAFLINGRVVSGAQPLTNFKSIIDDML